MEGTITTNRIHGHDRAEEPTEGIVPVDATANLKHSGDGVNSSTYDCLRINDVTGVTTDGSCVKDTMTADLNATELFEWEETQRRYTPNRYLSL